MDKYTIVPMDKYSTTFTTPMPVRTSCLGFAKQPASCRVVPAEITVRLLSSNTIRLDVHTGTSSEDGKRLWLDFTWQDRNGLNALADAIKAALAAPVGGA